MIPATAVSPHPINTLDRIAFYKSVREKRKQLQLNHLTSGKDINSSTENAFLTQMLQSSSNSNTSTSLSSSLSIPSLLCKGDFSPSTSSHRTPSSTLTNILPALLNGTLQSPRAMSPSGISTNMVNLNSPTNTHTTDALVDTKCSTSLPASPASHLQNINQNQNNLSNNNQTESSVDNTILPISCSPPRCRSYPTTVLSKRTSPSTSNVSCTQAPSVVQSLSTSTSGTSHLLSAASSCPTLANSSAITTTTNTMTSSSSPSPDDIAPKIVRSASVKSCASDSGVSSSSPLSDNNIVHVFRTNHIETINQTQVTTGSRKRKSLAHFYDELNKDKKFSTEATVASGFAVPTSSATSSSSAASSSTTTTTTTTTAASNNNIPYSQQEAIAIGYAQYALMQSLTQQFRVSYPAAFLHAAAASGYLPIPSPMMAAAVAAAATAGSATNGNNALTAEKFRERRKQQLESDNNNNHIRAAPSVNDQPYRRETYQTLLESSRLLGQHKLLKPVPIDLRKHNGSNRAMDNSPINSNVRYSSSSSSTSPSGGSPSSISPTKLPNLEPANDYVCIPKKLMPVISARINDWLERNVTFALSLSVIQETVDNDKSKFLLLSRVWHRLLLISMIENSFEIYVTKDLQITSDITTSMTHLPTENDVKQIESLITRGKTLEIDEIGFNLIRELIICKEGKTLFENTSADSFEKAECQAQAKLTTWCSSRVRYSKIVFFICNIYQVKEDIFERLFCGSSIHQSTPIHTHLERFLASASSSTSVDNA